MPINMHQYAQYAKYLILLDRHAARQRRLKLLQPSASIGHKGRRGHCCRAEGATIAAGGLLRMKPVAYTVIAGATLVLRAAALLLGQH